MDRTLAATWIKGRYWWIAGLTLGGILLAEVLYYHVFDLRGFIPSFFSIEDQVRLQGWWNDERKGVWIGGALWGIGVAAKIVLKVV